MARGAGGYWISYLTAVCEEATGGCPQSVQSLGFEPSSWVITLSPPALGLTRLAGL